MTKNHKLIVSLIMGIIGFSLIWSGANFVTALGCFMALWCNNLSIGAKEDEE